MLMFLALVLLKGLTGRPGDAGPQGKVGPSVSVTAILIHFSNFIYFIVHCTT